MILNVVYILYFSPGEIEFKNAKQAKKMEKELKKMEKQEDKRTKTSSLAKQLSPKSQRKKDKLLSSTAQLKVGLTGLVHRYHTLLTFIWSKDIFYFTMYSTHFIYGYMGPLRYRDRGNMLPLLFFISSKASFMCTIPHTGQYIYFLISSKGSFICAISQTGQYIPWFLLYQSWSTGWNEK